MPEVELERLKKTLSRDQDAEKAHQELLNEKEYSRQFSGMQIIDLNFCVVNAVRI